jgi:hypothetical protein
MEWLRKTTCRDNRPTYEPGTSRTRSSVVSTRPREVWFGTCTSNDVHGLCFQTPTTTCLSVASIHNYIPQVYLPSLARLSCFALKCYGRRANSTQWRHVQAIRNNSNKPQTTRGQFTGRPLWALHVSARGTRTHNNVRADKVLLCFTACWSVVTPTSWAPWWRVLLTWQRRQMQERSTKIGQPEEGRHFGDTGVDVRITLNWITSTV